MSIWTIIILIICIPILTIGTLWAIALAAFLYRFHQEEKAMRKEWEGHQ